MPSALLVINSGSSSIKFALFMDNTDLALLYQGEIENLYTQPRMQIHNAVQEVTMDEHIPATGHEGGLRAFFNWLENLASPITLHAVGHRIVHGGTFFSDPIKLTASVMEKLQTLVPLAPLHQGHNLTAVRIIQHQYPDLPQIACFDTTFHRSQEKLATLFALPTALSEAGILRYGFHGISYEYIASVLPQKIGEQAHQRVIVAHLGNGASMCAMVQGKSIATSMGFTALEGLMMGTRCGQIDPGVLLYLLQEKNYTTAQLEDLLYNQSGLLGVSGKSNDMRTLLASDDTQAQLAIDLFCYRAAREAGSLIAALNGLDVFVFTAGIGEHAAIIREKIGARLSHWLHLDDKANAQHALIISQPESPVKVCVIPTHEEYMIAQHTLTWCKE